MLSGAIFIIFGLVILIFRNQREETKNGYYFAGTSFILMGVAFFLF